MDAASGRDVLDTGAGYESLSVKDLLEARDLYHNHLTGKPNVVGTAIGLYLQDEIDLRRAAERHAGTRPPSRTEPRLLGNAAVRPDSWPCVLAFVHDWIAPDQFGDTWRPDDAIPTRLFMPDGRVVPVCVVRVTPAEPPAGVPRPRSAWPDTVLGGGYPLVVEVQGQEHVASVGCLVSDGHTTYALTNRHVCGAPGSIVYARVRGQRVRIGVAADAQLTHRRFSAVYEAYPGLRTWLTLDAGLVALDDLGDWTSQIYGLGEPGPLADISERTVSLRLIGAEVTAYGAASGALAARIKALFYRYKSLGGFDWVADFLLAPDAGDGSAPGPQTQPGDSGTVWTLPPAPGSDRRRPLALEWGGQSFAAQDGTRIGNFALATALSSVCRLLDVELVTDHNTGWRRYWGSEGHYTIAALACAEVRNPALAALMQANRDAIAFDVTRVDPGQIQGDLRKAQSGAFIPLADVPDIVWKQNPRQVPGGRDTVPGANHRTTGPEHPTHYADVDQTRASDGQTLLALCLADPANISVAFWQQFYDGNGMKAQSERGLLPFRVWQFFDAIVAAAREGDAARFVCAAGILSHYVGDACQPLHGSIYSDGYPDDPDTRTVHHKDGSTTEIQVKRGAGVHSTYEEKMVDDHADDLAQGIAAALQSFEALPLVASGHDAALATLQLMDRAAKAIPPRALVDAYIAAGGGTSRATRDALWAQFGQATIGVMADGARVLAMLWDSAWQQGGAIAGAAAAIPQRDLQALYEQADFVPSLDLDHIGPALSAAPPAASRTRPAAKAKPPPPPRAHPTRSRRPRAG
jgi:hypothetical protein